MNQTILTSAQFNALPIPDPPLKVLPPELGNVWKYQAEGRWFRCERLEKGFVEIVIREIIVQDGDGLRRG